ncbi:quinon protein alcohol dehydrogenase-like superfamily [Boletus edulis]|nr:quinon protein alcohol dehydrogenase-like superfamily [Boletus edulis]
MSSAVPQGSVNDGSRPLLVISAPDNNYFWELAYLPDGRRVVTGADGGAVKVWNLENGGQEGTSMEHKSGCIFKLAVTRDGTKIISSDEEGCVKVWDVESHKLVRDGDSPGLPSRQMINSLRLADVKTGALILGPLKGHNRNINYVLWSRDGSKLFSASYENTIHFWHAETGERIGHPWASHTNSVYSLSLSPDGSILASASEDRTVRFWDATTGDPIGRHLRHDESVRVVSFSPSGEFVVSIDNEKIYLWRVPWWQSVQSQISLTDLDMPRNAIHPAQLSLFHSPPPYSPHIPGTGQVLHLDFDAVTPASNHLTATALVLNLLLTLDMSDEVGLQYMVPDLSLGLDEYQRIFDIRLRKLARMHAFGTDPSTSVFRSSPNGDPKRIRKIDKIKQKLVEMLREIGFKLSNGRLPWSTLDADLRRKRYMITNWPHGVVRDRDKGVSGLSAEDTDRLHDALFVDERRIQFVLCGEESASNNDQVASSSVALSSDKASGWNNLSMMGKQPRFKVTTAAAFIERPQKRRRT